jgi:hypothetical protein
LLRIAGSAPSVQDIRAAVIDGIVSSVGSANLDMRSFIHNNEANAIVISNDFGRVMEATFERDQEASREITLEDWRRRGIIARLKEAKAAQEQVADDAGEMARISARSNNAARERKELADQAKALAEYNKAFATSQQKAAAAVQEWRNKLGSAFTPDMEKKIRDSIVKPTQAASSAFQELTKSIGNTITAQQARLTAGGTLTSAQQLELDLTERLTESLGKLTTTQRATIQGLMDQAVAAMTAADAAEEHAQAAKKLESNAPHSSARTPPTISAWWLRRSSANRSITLPAAPVFGSRAPKTTRLTRAWKIAPMHIAQGSRVT